LVSASWQKLDFSGAMSFTPTEDLPLISSCGQCTGAEDMDALLDGGAGRGCSIAELTSAGRGKASG